MYELTFGNYRCFSDKHPATIEIGPGFTAIVGPNNSGKSAILRYLYEFRETLGSIGVGFNGLLAGTARQLKAPKVADITELFWRHAAKSMELGFGLAATAEFPRQFLRMAITQPGFQALATQFNHVKYAEAPNRQQSVEYSGRVGSIATRPHGVFHVSRDGEYVVGQTSGFARMFQDLSSSLYLPAARSAIAPGVGGVVFDVPIGEAFVEHLDNLRTGPNKAHSNATRAVIEEVGRLVGIRGLNFQRQHDSNRLHVDANGLPFRLDEVGTGIGHILYALATASTRKAQYILIDEPEMGLHPQLQVEFLMALHKHAGTGVVFATHSIGLARAIADRIYAVQQMPEGHSIVHRVDREPGPAERAGEQSRGLYRELGYATTLLVEGPTDVTVFKRFLQKLELDRRVFVLQLGGRSLIKAGVESHLREVKAVCGNVIAVIDSEREADGGAPMKEHVGFQGACEEVDIPCHLTQLRATENYLTADAVQTAFGPDKSPLGKYQRLKGVEQQFWHKSDSCKAAEYMSRADIEATDVGEFLLKHCK